MGEISDSDLINMMNSHGPEESRHNRAPATCEANALTSERGQRIESSSSKPIAQRLRHKKSSNRRVWSSQFDILYS